MRPTHTLLLGIAMMSNAHAQVPSYVPTDGLVGWWPFNGNADDQSGIENHGIVNGPTLTTDRFGSAASAYYFDGLQNHMRVPDDANSTLDLVGNYSISCWALIESLTQGGHHLITKHIGNIDNQGTYTFVLSASSVPEGAYFLNAQATPEYTVDTYPSDTDYGFSFTDWYHFCVTYDDADDKLIYYINGSPYDSVSVQFEVVDNNIDLLIGTSFINSTSELNYSYHGKLDDIGIWNRDLSAEEIADLFLSGTVSVGESHSASSVVAYPNPTTGSIRLTNIPQDTAPQLFDATGRSLAINPQRQGQNAILDLGTYPTGLYFVRAGDRSFTIVRE